jgi:hypothetical protein
MKQEPMFSPTVFNFYHPTYMIPGTNLSGPEFEIHNSTTAISRIDFVNTLVYGSINDKTTTNISNFVSLASNPNQMLDAMSAALLHGNMSADMRNTLLNVVNGIPDNTRRARAALYLIGSSSQFQVSH